MIASRGRARIGLLVPYTNRNLEPDMVLMAPAGLSFHSARMGGYEEEAIPDEAQMQGLGAADLEGPLALLAGVKPDVVLYGCTSATLTHGSTFDRALAERIATRTGGAACITAAGALAGALAHLGVTRIGFASPYVPAINEMAIRFLAQTGVETVAQADIGQTLDNDGQGELAPEAVFELGLRADSPEAGALVLSCTEMRSVEILARLEAAVGKPVVSSNQALLFAAMQRLGFGEPLPGFGRLLEGPRL